jgi:hypothetical protein
MAKISAILSQIPLDTADLRDIIPSSISPIIGLLS